MRSHSTVSLAAVALIVEITSGALHGQAAIPLGQPTAGLGDEAAQVVNKPVAPQAVFLQAHPTSTALAPSQGRLNFKNSDGTLSTVLGAVTHQDPTTGAWSANAPILSQTANGWRLDGTAYTLFIRSASVSSHTLTQSFTDYGSRHVSVLSITFPALAYSTGMRYTFNMAGLPWSLSVKLTGAVSFSASVAKRQGPKTYSFPVSSSETLAVDANGNLVGDSRTALTRAMMVPKTGKPVPCTAWTYSTGAGAAFTCDDSSFTSSQFPYTIDPTTQLSDPTGGEYNISAWNTYDPDCNCYTGSGSQGAQVNFNTSSLVNSGTVLSYTSCGYNVESSNTDQWGQVSCSVGSFNFNGNTTVSLGFTISSCGYSECAYSESAAVDDVTLTVAYTEYSYQLYGGNPNSLSPGTSYTFVGGINDPTMQPHQPEILISANGGTNNSVMFTSWASYPCTYTWFADDGGSYSYTGDNCNGGSASNSQASINFGTGSIAFLPAFTGTKTVYIRKYNEGDSWHNVGTIYIIPPETVSTPSRPSGPSSGLASTAYSFSTGGSVSNLGNPVQYQFSWGDGSNSGWLGIGVTSASHSWSSANTFTVSAQARSATNNAVVSASSPGLGITIQLPTVVTPSFSPGPGNYSSAQNVTITATPSDAAIYYTTDGTTPTQSSTQYNTPILVGSTKTINAVAFKTGWTQSQMASGTYTIALQSQTITFPALSNQVFGTPPITLSATASSNLPVTFSSLTPSVCTVSGNSATILSGGTCTIQATQAGNSTYAAAPPVNQSFQVTPASQTITFGTIGDQTLGTGSLGLSATASSGLLVSFNSQTPSVCSVLSSSATLIATGTCTIQASQTGNSNYAAAAPVSQSFQVTQPAPTITTGSPLQSWILGVASSRSLLATGGTAPYRWSLSQGSLPDGLSMSSGGLIAGVPTVANTFTFTVQVTDSSTPNQHYAKPLTLGVLSVTPQNLPTALVNSTYVQPLQANGGVPPYTWTAPQTLPPGIIWGFDARQQPQLSGTPTTVGSYPLSVTVADSTLAAVTENYTLAVLPVYTVATSPTGLSVIVDDGQPCTTPCTFTRWQQGSSHKIAAPIGQVVGPNQYVFSYWSDGAPATHLVTPPSSGATYTAYFVQRVPVSNTSGIGSSQLEVNLGGVPFDWYDGAATNSEHNNFFPNCPANILVIQACMQYFLGSYAVQGVTGVRFQFGTMSPPNTAFLRKDNVNPTWVANLARFFGDVAAYGISDVTPTPSWDDYGNAYGNAVCAPIPDTGCPTYPATCVGGRYLQFSPLLPFGRDPGTGNPDGDGGSAVHENSAYYCSPSNPAFWGWSNHYSLVESIASAAQGAALNIAEFDLENEVNLLHHTVQARLIYDNIPADSPGNQMIPVYNILAVRYRPTGTNPPH